MVHGFGSWLRVMVIGFALRVSSKAAQPEGFELRNR